MDHSPVTIPLTRGYTALVDAQDAERVMQYKWRVLTTQGLCYAVRSSRVHEGRPRRLVYLHRFILDEPDHWIDHRDGDGLNCQRSNLRAATNAQNNCNRRPSSGYKGVTFKKRKQVNPWMASIKVNRKDIYLGYFPDEHQAARAYDAAARIHHGAFARLNFPDES